MSPTLVSNAYKIKIKIRNNDNNTQQVPYVVIKLFFYRLKNNNKICKKIKYSQCSGSTQYFHNNMR